MKQAWILSGGWDGHQPDLVSQRILGILEGEGYACIIQDSLDCLADEKAIHGLDLVVACWTMGQIKPEYTQNLSRAVGAGTALAGVHGGMCDAFRNDTHWQFMTGGNWVSHPGGDGIRYTVNICHSSSPITQGLQDFEVESEHYYLHIDPAIQVLATTRFPLVPYYHSANQPVDMPVAWTKFWGLGRVFYLSLGHHDDVFDKSPTAQVLLRRGLLWAGEGRAYALAQQLSDAPFINDAKMY